MERLRITIIGCLLAVVLCNASGCKNKNETASKNSTPIVAETTETPVTPPIIATEPCNSEEKFKNNAKVRLTTKFGDMVIVLYNETPLHRDNFLKLVGEKYYDGLLFHRCIKNFMIQGGDPGSRGAAMSQMLGNGGPGYTIPGEFVPSLIHKRGALAAARQGDQVNPKRESSGSQFYIVQGQKWNEMQLGQIEINAGRKMPGFKYTDEQKQIYQTIGGTAQLDMDYSVFGEIISGFNVLDSIAAQSTQRDRPLSDVTMNMQIIQKQGK